MQKITEMKKAHTGATSIGGSSLHGLSWNISINLGWMCFTHTYYNKVGTWMIKSKKKARQPCEMHTVGGQHFLYFLVLFNRACMSLYLFIIADTDQKNIARVAHDGIWILLIFDLL